MNAMLTINVRVVGRAAQAQLNQLATATTSVVNAGAGSKAKATLGFFDSLRSNKLINAGKNIQWIGRQLTFNFTLPLVAAGAALMKFSLDVQRSMTEVKKVYGDATFTIDRVNEETEALGTSFQLLSTIFGVHQKEVVDIAAAWASAGSAGRGLAENVQGTLEAMVLGELDAAKATEGLIAIQATWGLSTVRNADHVSELSNALATLNNIENQTGIRFEGLIDVLVRAGGVARTAGMTIQELAAMAAALVPATGSAVQAGTALKTIISRLQDPTQETIDLLTKMGFVVSSKEWLGSSVTTKLKALADQFGTLSTAQQSLASSVLSSRWQVNKFSVLMADMASETGYFNKAMEASNDVLANNKKYQDELQTVLNSNPKKWDIMTNAIRNSMADAFVPMIPVILQILGLFVRLARWFGELPDSVQLFIMMGLGMLALAGPVLSLIGVFQELFGLIQIISKGIALLIFKILIPAIEKAILAFANFVIQWVLGWIVVHAAAIGWAILIIAAIGLIIAAFTVWQDETFKVLNAIARGFGQLPGVIGRALLAVLNVVARIIRAIWDWLSYLNPFARHSPSLVDQVRAGVTTILNEYARLSAIPQVIGGALAAMDAFASANKTLIDSFRGAELKGLRDEVVKAGGDAGTADAMVASIRALEATLPALTAQIAEQTAVVAHWQAELDDANAVLTEAEGRLDAAEKALEGVASQMEAARDRISELANAPLTGMKAMEDQIWANEQAQNQLNLALLQYEKDGWTLDSIRDKYAAINGEIELLRGEQSDLRMSGAGSDVLATYEDQIKAIEDQRDSLGDTEQAIIDINKQLDSLDLEQRFLNLTKSITFDPLLRQIDQMVNSVAEMDFDDVVAGIQQQQALIAQLQPQYDALVDTVEREKAAVEAAKEARDAIANQLDAEEEKLQALRSAYTEIESLIRDMEDAMKGFADQSERAKRAKGGGGGGGDLFDAAAGADFPIAGGDSVLGPEGMLADIEAFNRELEQRLQDVFGNMKIDMLAPFRDAWEKVKAWVANLPWGKIAAAIAIGIGVVLLGAVLGIPAIIALAIGAALAGLVYVFMEYGGQIWEWTYEHVVEPIKDALSGIGDFFADLGKDIGGFFSDLAAGAAPFLTRIATIATKAFQFIVTAVTTAGNLLRTAWNAIWKYLIDPVIAFIMWMNTYVVPLIVAVLDLILAIIERVVSIVRFIIDQAINLIQVILDVLQEPFQIFVAILQGAATSISEIIQIIIAIFQFAWSIISAIWGLIGSFVMGIVGDIVDGLMTGFGNAVQFIGDILGILWTIVETAFNLVKTIIETALQVITGIIRVVTDIIRGDWGKAWGHIKEIVENIWNGIKKFIGTAIDGIKDVLKGAWDTIKGTASSAWQTIKDFILDPLGEVLEFIQLLPGKLIKLVVDFVDAGKRLGGALLDGIVAGVKAIGGFAADVGRALSNALIDAWNWVADRVNDFIPNQLGWGPFSIDIPDDPIPRLTRLHTGGVVPGGFGAETLAILQAGEIVFRPDQLSALMMATARAGAAVAPSTANAGGGDGATIINFYGNLSFPNITDSEDAKEFIENLKAMVD